MKTCITHSKTSGVSLVELLVAMTVGVLLVSMVTLVIGNGTRLTSKIQSDVQLRRDSKVALDYLEQDFNTIAVPEFGSSSIAVFPETVAGPNGVGINSLWLMFLSRPASTSNSKGIKTVSYRLVYNDPMTPGGDSKRLVVYRSVIAPQSGSDNRFLTTTDLHSDFWEPRWPEYQAEKSGQTLLEDYLMEGVVDIQATLNYTYEEAGELKLGSTKITAPVSWVSEGFAGDPAIPTPNSPVSITLAITTLSVEFYESGLNLEDLVNRKGVVVSRTIPFFSR